MVFDATFWVAISFIIFFGVLIYLKVPVKINESLNKLISDIKNELNESEKLRKETKEFLDQSQSSDCIGFRCAMDRLGPSKSNLKSNQRRGTDYSKPKQ